MRGMCRAAHISYRFTDRRYRTRMASQLFERTAEWAARFADSFMGRDVLLGVAIRRAKRSSYFEISSQDRARLQTEPVVEVAVGRDVICVRPTLPELSRKCHVDEIALACERAIGWQVTNSYLTDLFGRKLAKRGGFLSTVRHFISPIELARASQHYQSGWGALKQQLSTMPTEMSLTEFVAASRRAILSTMSHEQANHYSMVTR